MMDLRDEFLYNIRSTRPEISRFGAESSRMCLGIWDVEVVSITELVD